jgi:hypothetical protein
MKISVLLPILLPAVVLAGTTRGGATSDTLAQESQQRSLGFVQRWFKRRRDARNALNNDEASEPVVDSCGSDADCSKKENYCAVDGTCLPMGDCIVIADCQSPSNIYVLDACVGEMICAQQSCGIVCTEFDADPQIVLDETAAEGSCVNNNDCAEKQYCAAGICRDIDGECPDGSQLVNCIVQPCMVSSDCAEAAYCVDDYCGGCNAYHFDTEGDQVCV